LKLLGLDIGQARIGTAFNEGSLVLAGETVLAGDGAVHAVAAMCKERGIEAVVVGYPVSLGGNETASTSSAVAFAHALTEIVPVRIKLVDERLTSSLASRKLSLSGKNTKAQKSLIDAEAAREILDSALRIGFENLMELPDA
jgi:putative Holliday junction resolvase